ncbi:MAG: hypothetical protein EPO52_17535 [Herbiconiux sp.]|uniref:hypothetical protein n=1 Tax=Herbiconiux sp. TaxID=1871186 RepID=UPI00121BA4D5|nr:hypothetical protein [Herbiconiux sp.]TAJ46335.1 MAG: hypothetical protein EPO52_17535 [Herbiconiux sp.]
MSITIVSETTELQLRDDEEQRRLLNENHQCPDHEGCVYNVYWDDKPFDDPGNRWHHINVGDGEWYRVEVELSPASNGWDIDVYVPDSGQHSPDAVQELAAVLTIAAARANELNSCQS